MKKLWVLPVFVLALVACGGHARSTAQVAASMEAQANQQMAGVATVTSSYCVEDGTNRYLCYLAASDGSSIVVPVTCDQHACVRRDP